MRKRIIFYRSRIDLLLSKQDKATDWEDVLSEHLVQIAFFQHERLVHLIVTMTVAILTVISLAIGVIGDFPAGFVLAGMFTILLVPYIFHYYTLENEVQKMYEQYDEILKSLEMRKTDVRADV